MTRIAVIAVVISSELLLGSCGSTAAKSGRKDVSASQNENRPSFGTVLVDFSASFAPLTQPDRMALDASAATLADLAVTNWSPPTTIVWKRIGTNSATSKLLCDPFEFNRSILGAADASQTLKTNLKNCAERVVKSTQRPDKELEQYTDLAGAISGASQDWADVQGTKTLLILSDFLGDYKRGTHTADLRLHGERVVMLHRIGNMDASDVTLYLSRINSFRNVLLQNGAKSVVLLPTFRATKGTLMRAFSGDETSAGVTISIISNLRSLAEDDRSISRAVEILADALAKRALEWPSPVVLTWFAAGIDGRHTEFFVPVSFTPHLVHRTDADSPDETINADEFRLAIKQSGNVMLKRATPNGDMIGALELASGGESEASTIRITIVLSDLSHTADSNTSLRLNGDRVILLYRPAPSLDSATFQNNLQQWQSYLRRSGSSGVCAQNLATMTSANAQFCLTSQGESQ